VSRRPFQFSVKTSLVVITGVAIVVSLVRWDAGWGSLISVPLIITWWAGAAVRAGHRRLAYHLASVGMGVLGYALLSLPVCPVTKAIMEEFLPLSPQRPRLRIEWLPMTAMTVAALVSAAILRRAIRRSGTKYTIIAALLATYLTALLFTPALVALRIPVAIWQGGGADLSGFAGGMLVIGAIGSPVVATATIYAAYPMAILFSVLLRKIDPVPLELDQMDWSILRAVDYLRREGKSPVWIHQIVEEIRTDRREMAPRVDRLLRLGALTRSAVHGYRRNPNFG
jgi:hypothetical protein